MKKTLSLFALTAMLILSIGFAAACHCGDGYVTPRIGEECDDGNLANNDGCSSTCKTERCGDGILQTIEECDDGNQVDGDGCTANCTIEPPEVPEFGTIIGILTALGALGIFFIVRR